MLENPANILVLTINLLVGAFAIHAIATLAKLRVARPLRVTLALFVALALATGIACAWLPPLAKLRATVPIAQPLMVLGMTVGLFAAAMSGPGRRYLATVELPPLTGLHGWRLLFGSLLLALGLIDGLPVGFYPTVAIGDMLVGIWAISITCRGGAEFRELAGWSAVGLFDLLHVLPLGVIHFPPFYASHPEISPPLLLPLFGVPFLIALHGSILFRLLRSRKTTQK